MGCSILHPWLAVSCIHVSAIIFPFDPVNSLSFMTFKAFVQPCYPWVDFGRRHIYLIWRLSCSIQVSQKEFPFDCFLCMCLRLPLGKLRAPIYRWKSCLLSR